MDSPLNLVAVGLIAGCAALLVGRRERITSPRTITGITLGLIGCAVLVISGFLSGASSVLAWGALLVVVAVLVYFVVVVWRERRRTAASKGNRR